MDEDSEDFSRALEEDYYTFLNVPRDVSVMLPTKLKVLTT